MGGHDDATCLPCAAIRRVERVFTATNGLGDPMLGTRCEVCGSVTIAGGDVAFTPSDAFLDDYLQSEGGIDSIVANLYRVDAPAGARFLDVGANLGFGVRWARDVLGWTALGVEPSYAGRRGERELGVEILDQYVTAETLLGDRFDVIMASEVIEHVPDPAAFLHALRAHLAPGGTLVLTTPAAEIVAPATQPEALQAITPGGHLFVFSEPALHALLQSTGFGSVAVERMGATLVATAANEPDRRLRTATTGPSPEELQRFLHALATDPRSTPTLQTAMAVRAFRARVNQGVDAPDDEAAAFARVAEQYDIDLRDPAAVRASLPHRQSVPLLIAPAAFAAGMMRLVHRRDWREAEQYFALAEQAVAEKRRRRAAVFDGDSRIIEAQSRAHRLLALLHVDPTAALAEWQRLRDAGQLVDPASWTVRLYVEAAALENSALFDGQLPAVADAIAALSNAGGADHVIAAINGAYLLARAAAASGDRWCATQWASVAEQVLDHRGDLVDPAWRQGAERMLLGLRGEIAGLAAEAVPSVVPMPGPEHEAMLWQSADPAVEPGSVSVVMAFYRGERYVREALESIAQQTLRPREVIIVDDGSGADADALLSSIPMPVDLRIVRQGNAGQSAARNTGIRAARGEFIAFLDQDDVWRPQHLHTLMQTMQSDPDAAWVFSDFDLIDAQGGTLVSAYLGETAVALERRTLSALVSSDIMALPSASLMRRQALLAVRGFDRRLSGYEDDELALRLYRAGYAMRANLSSRIRYRTHEASASQSVAFLRSRLVFLRLLEGAFEARPGHATPSEAAIGRLLRSTAFDYVEALVRHDDRLARTIAWAARRMMRLAPRLRARHRLASLLMLSPTFVRAALRASTAMPAPLRTRLLPNVAESARARLVPKASRAARLDLDDRPAWLRARPVDPPRP